MHEQVFDWVATQVRTQLPAPPTSVLEIGSLDINGSVRPLFAGVGHYHGVDIVAGPGVDEVADAATWDPPRRYDVVVCAEVLEHAPQWRQILATMWRAVAPGGLLLMTCATDPRAPHSAVDGLDVRPEEHYRNVPAAEVRSVVGAWAAGGEVAASSITWAARRGDLYLSVRRAASP